MGKPANTGFMRVVRAARYSALGFQHAFRYESAFRQELALTLLMIPGGVWLARSVLEFVLLMSCCLFVLTIELLNSAIEAAIDRHGDEIHELSGRAKDLGSAAVFLSLTLTVSVWGAILYDRMVID